MDVFLTLSPWSSNSPLSRRLTFSLASTGDPQPLSGRIQPRGTAHLLMSRWAVWRREDGSDACAGVPVGSALTRGGCGSTRAQMAAARAPVSGRGAWRPRDAACVRSSVWAATAVAAVATVRVPSGLALGGGGQLAADAHVAAHRRAARCPLCVPPQLQPDVSRRLGGGALGFYSLF